MSCSWGSKNLTSLTKFKFVKCIPICYLPVENPMVFILSDLKFNILTSILLYLAGKLPPHILAGIIPGSVVKVKIIKISVNIIRAIKEILRICS